MFRLPKTLNAGLIINANNNLSLQLVIQVACKMLLLTYTVMITDAEAGNTHKRLKKIPIKLSEHKLLWTYQRNAVCELNHDTALKLLHFVTSQTFITSDLQGGTECKKISET